MGHVRIDADPEGPLVDERIAPLIGSVRYHGLLPIHCEAGDEGTPVPAHLIFPDVPQAMEFLMHTSLHTAYTLGDQIALTILHPAPLEESDGEVPRGKVCWLPCYTHTITEAWRVSQR